MSPRKDFIFFQLGFSSARAFDDIKIVSQIIPELATDEYFLKALKASVLHRTNNSLKAANFELLTKEEEDYFDQIDKWIGIIAEKVMQKN